jgi:hypothetical protein
MKSYQTPINPKVIFIGLAHVIANQTSTDILKGAKGAYVNVLCLAGSETEFINEAMKILNSLGLNLVDAEDVEAFNQRTIKYEVDDNLLNLAQQVNTGNRVMLGTFHTYR